MEKLISLIEPNPIALTRKCELLLKLKRHDEAKKEIEEAITLLSARKFPQKRQKLKRDAQNLVEYYEGLRKEMEQSLERSGLSDQLIRERREKNRNDSP